MFGIRTRKNTVRRTLSEALSASYTPAEIARIDELGTIVQLEDGSTITAQGHFGHEAVILLAGTAAVSRDGEPVATVGVGDLVGEASLVTGERRNASLVAEGPVEVVVFGEREFRTLLADFPRLETEVTALVARRAAAV